MTWLVVDGRRDIEWVVAPERSTAYFEVDHLRHSVRGTVPVLAGRLRLGPDGQPAAVSGLVDLSAITTGHRRRDRDLRKPRLLDLDRHPTMSFAADDITGTDGEWRITGVATARGRDVPLVCTVTGFVLNTDTVRVRAEAVLDRRALGLRAPEFLIGRWVRITLHVLLRANAMTIDR